MSLSFMSVYRRGDEIVIILQTVVASTLSPYHTIIVLVFALKVSLYRMRRAIGNAHCTQLVPGTQFERTNYSLLQLKKCEIIALKLLVPDKLMLELDYRHSISSV